MRFFYGTLTELENEQFTNEKTNPNKISFIDSGICFTTSIDEAKEVYATPPYNDLNISIEEALKYRKSEWYSKTEAIFVKSKNINYIKTQEEMRELWDFRKQIVEESKPCIYEVNLEIHRPFIVNNTTPINTEKYLESKFLTPNKNSNSIELDKFLNPFAVYLFMKKDKNIKFDECLDFFQRKFKGFSRRYKEPTTSDFFDFMSSVFKDEKIGHFSNAIKDMYDSMIIEEPKKYFANANNYDDNKHYVVFDAKKITIINKIMLEKECKNQKKIVKKINI